MNGYLDNLDARRVTWSISLLIVWLRQADEHVLEELAEFGFGLRLQPRRHLDQLIDHLEAHAAVLRAGATA